MTGFESAGFDHFATSLFASRPGRKPCLKISRRRWSAIVGIAKAITKPDVRCQASIADQCLGRNHRQRRPISLAFGQHRPCVSSARDRGLLRPRPDHRPAGNQAHQQSALQCPCQTFTHWLREAQTFRGSARRDREGLFRVLYSCVSRDRLPEAGPDSRRIAVDDVQLHCRDLAPLKYSWVSSEHESKQLMPRRRIILRD
jgi:hypothetical protein